MVFSSYVVGLFGLFILEFSLWNNFGNYIWYVSIGFTILDMVIGDIVSYQLKEVSGTSWAEGPLLFVLTAYPHRRHFLPGEEQPPEQNVPNMFYRGS